LRGENTRFLPGGMVIYYSIQNCIETAYRRLLATTTHMILLIIKIASRRH
jgi:hypothetical protein